MNQPHKDQAKKRQKYLWKKSIAAVIILASVFFATVLSVLILAIALALLPSTSRVMFPLTHQALQTHPIGYLLSAILLSGCVLASVCLLWLARNQSRQVATLPYVPSVDELRTIANLPVEEVLLRGSDHHTATPDELLRAAQAGIVEPKEEFLRPEQAVEETTLQAYS